MPYLDPDHRLELLGDRGRVCSFCHTQERRDYCRQCDEFFRWCCEKAGLDTKHAGHRRYLRDDGSIELNQFPLLKP